MEERKGNQETKHGKQCRLGKAKMGVRQEQTITLRSYSQKIIGKLLGCLKAVNSSLWAVGDDVELGLKVQTVKTIFGS